jgi:glucose-1-phosphate cytidylyltransferase
MKVVILAGGLGTRLSEETDIKPKPMVEIGGKPILWHIMKLYSHYGFHEFVICLGYKGYIIKEYFANYLLHQSDVTIDLEDNSLKIHQSYSERWKVTLIDTGLNTMTGGRIKRIQPYIGNEAFLLTYGDGVGDIDIPQLIRFHEKHREYATITAVKALSRFGVLQADENGKAVSFLEKPQVNGELINGGFFVLRPEVFDYIRGDDTVWEGEPLERISHEGHLAVYQHPGFWKPMDTLRDKKELEQLWALGKAQWKVWND